MKKHFVIAGAVFVLSLLLAYSNVYASGSKGTAVDQYCEPRGVTPYGGPQNCTLCHANTDTYELNPLGLEYFQTGNIDLFCPLPDPVCTDNDGDGYAVEGGDCGPVDCDDADVAVHPGAVENCTDGFDNNCNGLVDNLDPAAVGCPPACTDNDGDTYSPDGGDCGPIDCDDSDRKINPAAAETCADGVDNNCNGAIDEGCGPVCTDRDRDGFAVEGGDCGPVDCADRDRNRNPNAAEICDDGIDNNCNGAVDENCGIVCTDNDSDGFSLEGGDCGEIDCDDTDDTIFPGADENCTDGKDNNCNGLIDTLDTAVCVQLPTCTDNDGDGYAVEGGDCGVVDCDDTDAGNSPDSEEFCGDGQDNDCDGDVDEGCDAACTDADGDTFEDAACGGSDCNDGDVAINPAAGEICGNGIDENCNGMSDDKCPTSPADPFLTISHALLNERGGNLTVSGRANPGANITITDADSGKILIGEIPALKGKWRTLLRNLGEAPGRIHVTTSDGLAVDQNVSVRRGGPQGTIETVEGVSYRMDSDRDDDDYDHSETETEETEED